MVKAASVLIAKINQLNFAVKEYQYQ